VTHAAALTLDRALPVPGLDFVAIDFETANRKRASVCAIGLARVRRGLIVKTAHWLVRPPESVDYFEDVNIGVHGITPGDVAGKPRFGEMLDRLLWGIEGETLVAHNAAFDRGVLTAAATEEDRTLPHIDWLCTRRLAERHLPVVGRALENYQLPTVSRALGVDLDSHHDAGADSNAAAGIMVELACLLGWSSVEQIAACAVR
jgi:DNA polymerase-3 subunit epsilon